MVSKARNYSPISRAINVRVPLLDNADSGTQRDESKLSTHFMAGNARKVIYEGKYFV